MTAIRHKQYCIDKWSMEIQVCTCGAAWAQRQLDAKDAEIKRLNEKLVDRQPRN